MSEARVTRKRSALGGFALAATILLAFPGAALATDGTATLVPGSLSIGIPATVDFSGTLNGLDQVLSDNQGLDVIDATGSGDGWHITLTTTQFTTGGATPLLLGLTAASDMSSTGACDSADPTDCDMAADSTAVIAIPAATVAPAAVVIQTAAQFTGLGPQTFTHVMNLATLASAKAGHYTSTWTYSLITAP
jgi:hypothetical protein